MFNDDENDFGPIEDLLWAYQSIKAGNKPGRFLEAEDFEAIAEYYLHHHRAKDAQEAIHIALQFHPQSIELMVMKVEMLLEAQNFGQALNTLDEIELINPFHMPSIILRSDVLMEMEKEEEAIRNLLNKIEKVEDRDKIELLMSLSDIYDELARFESVYDALIEVLRIDPDYAEALYKLSFWADLANKNEESITFHQQLLDTNPFNQIAWYNLASAYHSRKQYEEAIDAYEYCIALDEQVEAAYRNVADAYMKVKKFDRAIEALEKNLEIGKPEDVIYEAMGHCFEKKKDYSKARYYYRQAIKLSPADDLFFFRIGETYTREKKYELAYESYLSAFKLNEENHSYAYALGLCQLETGNAKDAVIYFLKSISLKPNQKNTWIQLSKALYHLDLFEEVINQKEIAEEHCGEKAEFEFIHAAALLAQGKSKEALSFLKKGLEMAPSKIKLLQELQPDVLTRKSVADLVAQYRKK